MLDVAEAAVANAGAAETSRARDKAEPVKTFFIFILNTPFLFFDTTVLLHIMLKVSMIIFVNFL
ncbi:hypothetical protein B425_2707 [Bacillus amyloliquefaciens]|nr:hypothetical protein LL3_02217 [Bacillus amyloliquefaciens LL3]KYC95852.1 hypothetical protein B425_2707 [Bacillus amyloliquefaciens]